jgi:DNA-binding transcriptional regulator YiaG
MQIEEWLQKNKMSPLEFSKKVNASRAAVYQWRIGKFKPNKFYQKIIHKETKGEVSYEDWEAQ